MRKHVLASLTVATTLGVFVTPLSCYAFGLGKLELMSALNQPLKAEIDVTALQNDERDNLQVTLASMEEFQKAGLDRHILLTQLNFDVVGRDAQTKVLVTSKQAIKEPFLNFLLTATIGSGRLLREYTVLLDPPEYFTAKTRSTTQNTAISSAPAPSQQALSAASVSRYGPVKATDTLWNIASSTMSANDISVQQMMMAILNANPNAFVNNNVNGLKADYTLQIPAESTVRALSKNDAIATFNEQNTAWSTLISANSSGIAEASEAQADIISDKENEQSDVVAAATSSEDNDTKTTTPIDDDSRLNLVAPEDDVNNEDDASPNVTGDDELSKLTQQLTLAQETIEAQTQENIDFKARMDAMEEQIETMRRLISLKDADLARLQDLLEEDPALTADDTLTEIETEPTPQPTATDVANNDEFNLQEDEQTIADNIAQAVGADTRTADAMSVGTADEVDTTADENVLTEPVEMGEQPLTTQGHILAFMAKLKQFIVSHTGPVAALALFILLLLLLLLRRRGQDEIIDEDEVLDVAPAAMQTPLNDKPSSLTDAPLDEPEEQKSVDELLQQADMFVGYADYIQAKQALILARELEPANMLVAYKLLFVLFKQKQAEQFLSVVEENGFNDQYDAWEEIRNWGHELMPENSLFFAGIPLSETIISADEDDENILADATEPRSFDTVEFDSASFETKTQALPSTFEGEDRLEFNLADEAQSDINDPQSETVEFTSELTDSDDDLLSFDASEYSSATLYEDDDSVGMQKGSENGRLTDELMAFTIDETDITLPNEDMDEIDIIIPDEDESFEIDDLSVPDLEFDIDDLDEMDEAETKLELAQAYVDMGDAEGAKSILTEMLTNGTTDQQARAQDLLNKL